MAEDLLQMQREAARRVNRMQEHSRRVFEEHRGQFDVPPRGTQAAGFTQPTMRSSGLYNRYAPPPVPLCEEPKQPIPNPKPIHAPTLDGEQWLLLGLALLLFRSGCRPELAIALLYLAL